MERKKLNLPPLFIISKSVLMETVFFGSKTKLEIVKWKSQNLFLMIEGSLTQGEGSEKCSRYFRWKSDQDPKFSRSFDEADNFYDVIEKWKWGAGRVLTKLPVHMFICFGGNWTVSAFSGFLSLQSLLIPIFWHLWRHIWDPAWRWLLPWTVKLFNLDQISSWNVTPSHHK